MTNNDPSSALTPEKPQKQKWRWLRRIAVALLVLALGVIALRYIIVWRAETHLSEVTANLSFKLIPAKDVATLWGPAPTESDNAAPLYVEIKQKFDELLTASDTREGETSAQAKRKKEFERLQVIWGLQPASEYPWDEAEDNNAERKIPQRDLAQALKFLGEFAEVFKIRDEAIRRSSYREMNDWSKSITIMLPDLSTIYELARLSLLESAVAAEERDWPKAYAGTRSIFQTARLLEQQPIMIESLYACAIRGQATEQLQRLLPHSPPAKETAEELRALLPKEPKERLKEMLTSEAVIQCGLFDDFLTAPYCRPLGFTDDLNWPPSRYTRIPVSLWFTKPFFLEEKAKYLATMDRYVRACEPEAIKTMAGFRSITADLPPLEKHTPLFLHLDRILLCDFSNLPAVFYRDEACGKMLEVALEVSAWRQANGKYPGTLAELPSAGKLPRDPFTVTGSGAVDDGKPFGYSVTDDGFMLWSVGPEGVDHGGKTAEELGLKDRDQGDIVFHVPPAKKSN